MNEPNKIFYPQTDHVSDHVYLPAYKDININTATFSDHVSDHVENQEIDAEIPDKIISSQQSAKPYYNLN